MKIMKVKLHNFKTYLDQEFKLANFSLVVGKNNAGKSNLIKALRIFYEDQIKFDVGKDFPKSGTDDDESWIEISYLTDRDEQNSLREEYKSDDNILRVRKYLKSETKVKNGQSNIYAYEGDQLSENNFYGAKNISESKLGKIIFIPAVSKIEENLKLTGPSPVRSMINFVTEKILESSNSYTKLVSEFENFERTFKSEEIDGYSLEKLENHISEDLKEWDVKFGLRIGSIKPEDITKNQITFYLHESIWGIENSDLDAIGSGLQRQIIFSLIKRSSEYRKISKSVKKDFNPNYTLLLFEEPEAFLHPSQQEILNLDLKYFGDEEDQQVIATTHSPLFVSKQVEDLTSLIRVSKHQFSELNQVNSDQMSELFSTNYDLTRDLDHLENRREPSSNPDYEEFKYFLWLDSERASCFFADMVLICEGATEKALFDYLLDNEWRELKLPNMYVLDALGKWNVHKFMKLFGLLNISHSVLVDSDNESAKNEVIRKSIEDSRNSSTKAINYFEKDIENYFGIQDLVKQSRSKPVVMLHSLLTGKLDQDKLDELKTIVKNLTSV